MYFFSEIDPNYRIKGSRDPLGFQTLWAAAGRKVIAHLSTVSINLRDFMILSYGIFFHDHNKDIPFVSFFLKFEQVCAYARKIHGIDEGFNGVDFVNKKKDQNTFSISLKPADTLLSNQRNYGIYGKYIRPYRDMRIDEDDRFYEIIEDSLKKSKPQKVMEIVNRIMFKEETQINKDELIYFADLLSSLTQAEKELYRKHILRYEKPAHPQNTLYEILQNNRQIAESEFHLHAFIQSVKNQSNATNDLEKALDNIAATDRVLFPLNRSFTHLLSQSTWSSKQIRDDEFFDSLPSSVNSDFQDEIMRELNGILNTNDLEKVERIINRNKDVSSQRGSKEWIIKEKDMYKVIYGETGQKQREIDFETQYEYLYFLNTYLNLYRQIELN